MLQLQHNIVSILYTIKSMAESHREQTGEGCFQSIDEVYKHAELMLEKIYSQADRALLITKKLGCAMKSENADKGKRRAAVSIKKAWQFIMKRLENEGMTAEIEIITRIPDKFPLIGCDRQDFYEMLYCLANNALHALRESKTVHRKLIIRAELAFNMSGNPTTTITLADTGPGISQESLTRLFHPFYTTKPGGRGSGLGLYLTRELAERNGGRVGAMSYAGCGSTFVLELPVTLSNSSSSHLAA